MYDHRHELAYKKCHARLVALCFVAAVAVAGTVAAAVAVVVVVVVVVIAAAVVVVVDVVVVVVVDVVVMKLLLLWSVLMRFLLGQLSPLVVFAVIYSSP